jgi:hypothetical protein
MFDTDEKTCSKYREEKWSCANNEISCICGSTTFIFISRHVRLVQLQLRPETGRRVDHHVTPELFGDEVAMESAPAEEAAEAVEGVMPAAVGRAVLEGVEQGAELGLSHSITQSRAG